MIAFTRIKYFTGLAATSLMLLFSGTHNSQAHLLNMSRVTVTLEPSEITVDLSLDLTISAGSKENYFRLAQLEKPLADAEVLALIDTMMKSISLELDNNPLPLHFSSINFPVENEDAFLDKLNWPRTDIHLTAVLPTPLPANIEVTGTNMRIRFKGDVVFEKPFIFEEPIATTFQNSITDKSMTRWLVTGQYSPNFDASAWLALQNAELDFEQTSTFVEAPDSNWQNWLDYIRLGFFHILPGGIDHLLFVLGLCLGAKNIRSLVLLISLFTVAHTVSLGITTLGIINAPAHIVEPLIIVSILWLGIENLWLQKQGKGSRLFRPVLVLLFGLVHGMGFAGALKDIGLPSEGFIPALLSFNIGVELGQLLFIAGVLALLYPLKKFPEYQYRIVTYGSTGISAIAGYWLINTFI